MAEGATIDSDNVITLSADIVLANTSKITIDKKSGYTLAIGEDIATTQGTAVSTWEVKGTTAKTATYKLATPAYYTVENSSSTILYHAPVGDTTYFTISGLGSDVTTATLGDESDAPMTVNESNSEIKVTASALDGDVTLKGTGYKLVLAEEADATADDITPTWEIKNGTATLKATYEVGKYLVSGDGTKITKVTNSNKTVTLATITGLDSKLKAADLEDIEIDDNKKITLTNGLLGTSNVNIKGNYGYSLAIPGADADAEDRINTDSDTAVNKWVISGNNAAYKNVIKAYWTPIQTTDTVITGLKYTREGAGTTLATVKGVSNKLVEYEEDNVSYLGVKSGDTYSMGVGIDSTATDTIVLYGTAVDAKNITLTNAENQQYKLALDDETVVAPDQSNLSWKINGSTLTLNATGTAGYEITDTDATVVTYTAAATNAKPNVLATISGVKSGLKLNSDKMIDGIELPESDEGTDSKVITLSDSVLDSKKVTIKGKNGYTLALDEDVTTSDTADSDTMKWEVKNGTATYKMVTPEYYTLDSSDTVIAYTKEIASDTYITISGLDSSVKAWKDEDDGTYYIGTDTTSAQTAVNVDTDTKQVQFDKSILPKKANTSITVKLGAAFDSDTKITLVDDNDYVQQVTDSESWSVSNGTATLKANFTAGYKIDGNKITYNSAQTGAVLATISGLNSSVKASDLTDTNKFAYEQDDVTGNYTFIILDGSLLGTSKVTVKPTDKNAAYTLALEENEDTGLLVGTDTARTTAWLTKGTTAYYEVYTPAYYTTENSDTTIVYNKVVETAEATEKYAKLTGLASGVDLNDDTIFDGSKLTLKKAHLGTGAISFSGGPTADSDTTFEYEFAADVSGHTITATSDTDVITINGTKMNVKAGDGDDEINIVGKGNTVSGGKGNDSVNFNGTGGNTYIYTGGNDEISGFTSSDKLQISGSISDVSVSSSSIEVIFKGGDTLTVSGNGMKMGTSDKFTYANGSWTRPAEKSDSSELADSADLIYDDDNFTDYGLSEIVNDSLDTYSVGNLNETKNLTDLTAQSDFLTYGNDDKTNK